MDLISKDCLFAFAEYKTITPKPRSSSTFFYFVLDRFPRLDIKMLVVVNRLMRIVPHHKLGLLTLLLERELIGDRVNDDMRRERTLLHLQSETDAQVFKFIVKAIDVLRRRFYKAINDFLSLDDKTMWNRARAVGFVEFE